MEFQKIYKNSILIFIQSQKHNQKHNQKLNENM